MDNVNFPDLPSANLEELPLATVPIDKLAVSGSPRISGENRQHIRIMARSENPLPPILVHYPTMRVLDGIHRLRVAGLRGEHEIEVRLFDGDEASSFVLAVRANAAHGLPLSLTDRRAAAARIVQLCPQWSDRSIASMVGLAHRTVAKIRNRPTGQNAQLDKRVGRDGRRRPLDAASQREFVSQVLAENPDASLREVARKAHISPETARRVRAGLTRTNGSMPSQEHDPAMRSAPATDGRPRQAPVSDSDVTPHHDGTSHAIGTSAWQALCGDPALRSTETGRSLLRVLSLYQVLQDRHLLDNVPPHCMSRVAAAARECARAWQDLADRAEQRSLRR